MEILVIAQPIPHVWAGQYDNTYHLPIYKLQGRLCVLCQLLKRSVTDGCFTVRTFGNEQPRTAYGEQKT